METSGPKKTMAQILYDGCETNERRMALCEIHCKKAEIIMKQKKMVYTFDDKSKMTFKGQSCTLS